MTELHRHGRGNSYDRRRRKDWLMEAFADPDNPGYVQCYHCAILLDRANVTVDRIIPGVMGGTYRRSNIRPSCLFCNQSEGAKAKADALRELMKQVDELFPEKEEVA